METISLDNKASSVLSLVPRAPSPTQRTPLHIASHPPNLSPRPHPHDRPSPCFQDEKRRKYSDYACHELHLFLRRKDPAFFDDVVRPYLRHKRHKTFMDQYLLMADDKSGAELVEFLDPPRLAALNACERVLLARALDEAGVRPTGVPGATHRELERKVGAGGMRSRVMRAVVGAVDVTCWRKLICRSLHCAHSSPTLTRTCAAYNPSI